MKLLIPRKNPNLKKFKTFNEWLKDYNKDYNKKRKK